MHVIILGAPGSGKGTQSAKIIQAFDLNHLSTGDILRAEIAACSDLGLAAKSIIAKGDLISDDIIMDMVAERVKKSQRGFLFDGFPRTIAQAKGLDALLASLQSQLCHVIELVVSDDESVKRMLERGRTDDNEETIRYRLKIFAERTAPLINFYRRQNKLSTIAGGGDADDVFSRIQAVLAHNGND